MTFAYYLIQGIHPFLLLLFLNLVLLSVFVISQAVMAQYSKIDINQTDISQISQYSPTSVNASNVYVVWQDDTFGNYDIFFSRSTDNGKTFSNVLNISNSKENSNSPEVSSSGNNVYVVWEDKTHGNYDIFFARSTDNGKTFDDAVNLSNSSGNSILPYLFLTKDTIYVEWLEEISSEIHDFFFARSVDNGQTFSSPFNISNSTVNTFTSDISPSGNNVYAVWEDENLPRIGDIFFARSTDNGKTFDDAVNLSNSSGNSHYQDISSLDNNVYVIWSNNSTSNYDIFFSRSTDNGKTFDDAVNLSNNSGNSYTTKISSSGNNVYVVWYDNTLGNGDILFSRSTDNGKTFSDAVNLSNSSGNSYYPRISSSGNNVYVVWYDNTPENFEVFFARSTDNGQTFSTPINLSNNTGGSSTPLISSSEDKVYVTWFDDTSRGIGDIFFTMSQDNGQTFSTPINLSNNIGNSIFQGIFIK